MPQIIIHGSSMEPDKKEKLLSETRNVIPEILKIPDHIGQVIFYETATAERSIHPERDRNFIFIQIFMYPGRSQDLKDRLVHRLISLVSECSGVGPGDINCVIQELPPENFYGGVSHKYIEKLKQ